MKAPLNKLWMLCDELPYAREGATVLVNRTTLETYGPTDLVQVPARYLEGRFHSGRTWVERLLKAEQHKLSIEQLGLVGRFLEPEAQNQPEGINA